MIYIITIKRCIPTQHDDGNANNIITNNRNKRNEQFVFTLFKIFIIIICFNETNCNA